MGVPSCLARRRNVFSSSASSASCTLRLDDGASEDDTSDVGAGRLRDGAEADDEEDLEDDEDDEEDEEGGTGRFLDAASSSSTMRRLLGRRGSPYCFSNLAESSTSLNAIIVAIFSTLPNLLGACLR